jgi:hypothetical protein
VNWPPFPISLSFWVELVGACNLILRGERKGQLREEPGGAEGIRRWVNGCELRGRCGPMDESFF